MRKQSSYRPRPVRYDNLAYILQGNLPCTVAAEVLMRINIANHSALTSMKDNTAVRQDVFALSHAFTTALSLAKYDIGADYHQQIKDGQAAIAAVLARMEKWKVLQVTPSELGALDLALEVHDAQLSIATVAELENAIKKAKEAIRCNH